MAAQERNHALDGVRGLAALAVALGHCNLTVTGLGVLGLTVGGLHGHTIQEVGARLAYFVFPSDAAVTLFFVLSGHVLWESFFAKYPASPVAFPEYLCSRLYRLLPTAAACAIPIGLLAGSYGPALSARDLARTMLILTNKGDGVLWSLQVEVVCSLLLFFVWMIVRRVLGLHLFALAASVAVFRFDPNTYTLFFPAFLAGALIARLPAQARRHLLLIVAGVPLLVMSSFLLGHDSRSRYCEIVGAFLIIAYVGQIQPGFVTSRSVHFLGRISYPFYILHILGLQLSAPWVAAYSGGQQWLGFLIFAIGSLSITIPLAWLIHVAVELPAMRGRPRIGAEWWPARKARRSRTGAVRPLDPRLKVNPA